MPDNTPIIRSADDDSTDQLMLESLDTTNDLTTEQKEWVRGGFTHPIMFAANAGTFSIIRSGPNGEWLGAIGEGSSWQIAYYFAMQGHARPIRIAEPDIVDGLLFAYQSRIEGRNFISTYVNTTANADHIIGRYIKEVTCPCCSARFVPGRQELIQDESLLVERKVRIE